ncbi:uncharacterized protein RCC_01686 [Ramularia collo-cygni]|uniref:Uncharacterized protein n=1 Tax=Ramularia collo-cygni TaxID=112498 RepID=A0A2D3USY6_9PEZI|nr:uncharacterized protein RCC_01686 [Ramularia collo-cygni]CZT15850.1 uncharacterized protein RCC_01686 [Ramularia collo-cygni]
MLAFGDVDPPRGNDRGLCDAEVYNQVWLLQRSVEEVLGELIPRPFKEALPAEEVVRKLEILEGALREQIETSGRVEQVLHLPRDFTTLMRLTDGVHGAGVPSETDHLELVFPLERQVVEEGILKQLRYWARYRCEGIVIAGWKIGGGVQHRGIYYVLLCCRAGGDGGGGDDGGGDDGDSLCCSWKVFDHVDVEVDVYEDLG